MNKKGIVTVIGVVLMLAGLFGAMYLKYDQADILALVTAFAGAGMVLYGILDKKENKTWKDYVFLIAIAVGAVLFVFGGFEKDTILTLVGAMITVIGVIISILFKKKA